MDNFIGGPKKVYFDFEEKDKNLVTDIFNT